MQSPDTSAAPLVLRPIVRVFVTSGCKDLLPDPHPGMSPQKVRQSYTPQYPHLVNATIEGPTVVETETHTLHTFTFAEMVGKKG